MSSRFPADPPSEFHAEHGEWDDLDALPSRTASLHGPLPPLPPGEEAASAESASADEIRHLQYQIAHLDTSSARSAALLALLLTPRSARERQAWTEETTGISDAALALMLVQRLPSQATPSAREQLLLHCSNMEPARRVDLLRSVRRIMCADGKVRPIDRLRWLLIRHVLARPYGQDSHTVRGSSGGNSDMAILAPTMRRAVAHLTAFLARVVPQADPVNKVGTLGVTWYRTALRPWWGEETPVCELPDGDQLVQAIVEVRTLSWMQRPVLVRTWTDSAFAVVQRQRHAPGVRPELPPEAAEALRLVSRLLDTPLPPTLARCFIEWPDDPPGGHTRPLML